LKTTRLSGLIAAPFTPFNSDLTVNLDAVPQIAQHLVKQKVSGAFIVGSTGEYASLTQGERISLAEAWRKAAGPELKVIVHVGHNAIAECRALAAHAEKIGADAIGALMPSYFRPRSVDAAVEYCRQITEVAPNTPFYYYHIPDMTGVNLDMVDLLPKIIEKVPTFRGIKFTHSNIMDYSLALANAGDAYDILYGRDETLLAGLALGANGAVGSTYNYSARLYLTMIAAYRAGDIEAARRQQIYIQRSILTILKHGGQAVNKAIMAMAGVNCGPVRTPLTPLAPDALSTVRKELDSLGFFEAVNVSAASSSKPLS
jgi:N-acetylneuraminate lyase